VNGVIITSNGCHNVRLRSTYRLKNELKSGRATRSFWLQSWASHWTGITPSTEPARIANERHRRWAFATMSSSEPKHAGELVQSWFEPGVIPCL